MKLGQLDEKKINVMALFVGISELVMNSDDLAKNLAQSFNRQLGKSPSPMSGSEKNYKQRENFYIYPLDAKDIDDELLSQSSDINFAQESQFYRFRTNTDAKLDKLSDIRKKMSQIKTVKCDDTVVKFNEEMQDDDVLFVRKDISKIPLLPITSKLSEQLENLPPMPVNRFRKYSCFDGTSHPPNEIRTIQVFVVPFPEDYRDYPLRCCVQAGAKIEEFIGFILFKCTQDLPDAALRASFGEVNDYGLFISDETGELDLDFPALDVNEQVQRFQFSHLALSKRIEQFPKKRALSDVSEAATLIHPFTAQLSVDNKSLPTIVRGPDAAMTLHDTMVEAPIYRAYRVYLISKKHFRTEVRLGISGEKVEIDPLQQKNANYFFKPVKAIHYSMDSVQWCQVTSRKSNRFEFRIAHDPKFTDQPSTSNSFVESTSPTPYTLKIHTFETDPTSAEEIVMKMKNIMEMSSFRREYLNRHEKTKKSFIKKKKFPI